MGEDEDEELGPVDHGKKAREVQKEKEEAIAKAKEDRPDNAPPAPKKKVEPEKSEEVPKAPTPMDLPPELAGAFGAGEELPPELQGALAQRRKQALIQQRQAQEESDSDSDSSDSDDE